MAEDWASFLRERGLFLCSFMLGINVRELLEKSLADNQRPTDGKLHPSGDLIGSLRHAQLRAAGAPTIPNEVTGDVNLMTGTLWHSHFERIFRDEQLPVMCEVRLDEWLPEGWAGTCDWLVWSREHQAFVLIDLKTTRPEAIKYIQHEGIKLEHQWQASAYWYALEKMGIPLVRAYEVFYLPKYYSEGAEPLQLEGQPLAQDAVLKTMNIRWVNTRQYLIAKEELGFVNRWLAAEQERQLHVRPNAKTQVMDLKLEPHWSTRFCPFPDELCSCRHQKSEKVGHYYYDLAKDEVFYMPRKGYHAVQPELKPTKKQEEQLREWERREAGIRYEQHQRSAA